MAVSVFSPSVATSSEVCARDTAPLCHLQQPKHWALLSETSIQVTTGFLVSLQQRIPGPDSLKQLKFPEILVTKMAQQVKNNMADDMSLVPPTPHPLLGNRPAKLLALRLRRASVFRP